MSAINSFGLTTQSVLANFSFSRFKSSLVKFMCKILLNVLQLIMTKKRGRPQMNANERKIVWTVRLPPKIYRAIKKAAKRKGISMSQYALRVLLAP